MDGIATAAQNNGIAGFKGQRKRIDRNIWAAFKNHGNHAQRHAFLNNLQTVQIGIAADNPAQSGPANPAPGPTPSAMPLMRS